MEQFLSENHLVYKIRECDLYAAIDASYLRDIRQYAVEYQCLSDVPADRLVRALVFKVTGGHLHKLREGGTEISLPVNRLEFDTGNLRLSA